VSNWTDEELEGLENPENWDWESGTMQPPVRNPRAVVRIPFATADFGEIAAAARRAGTSLTEFISSAALAQAREQSRVSKR
jgi:hypothetical protein